MKNQLSRKTASLCLLFALLLTSSMTACGNDAAETTANTNGDTQTDSESTAADESLYVADYLPNTTYDGYEYRIYDYEEYPSDIEEPSGNIINDAIYKRNIEIEEKYDITFTTDRRPYTKYEEVSVVVRNSAMAQSDDFDLACASMRNAYNHVLAGECPAATQLPIIDMTKPWHNRILAESLTIDGVTILDYTAMDVSPGGFGIIFNKKLVEDFGMDSPYDLVDEGKWVYDTFYSMAEQVISDLDGDGKMTVNDRYGIIGEWDRFVEFAYQGVGLRLIEVENGIPQISMSEALVDTLTNFVHFRDITGSVFDTFAEFGTAESSRIEGFELFKEGRSLFVITGSSTLTTMGDMEDDYGIVPYPKGSEAQEVYYSRMDAGRIYLPLSCSTDLERVCVIKEALAVGSLNYYYPVYYEDAIQNRYVRDTDSIRMLELITNGMYVDLGSTIWWDIIRAPWLNCIQQNSTDFASAVAKNESKGQKAIDDLLEAIDFIRSQE